MKKYIFFIILFFTGCWNYRELNSLAITTAIAIDKKDNMYEVSILIANTKKNNSSLGNNESETIVYTGKGNNISQALNEIDLLSPKKIYIEHLSVLIISKEIASNGLADILDYFLRNSESTKRFQLVLADNAKDIIKILKPLEAYPASSISKNFKLSNETQAKSSLVLYSDFLYTLLEKGINPVLPTIKIIGNSKQGKKNTSLEQTTPSAITKLDNMALFKNDKLVTITNNEETKAINIINNKINNLNIYLKCNYNTITLKVMDIHSKIKIIDPKKLIFKLIVNGNATIIENNCNIDLTDPNMIDNIQKKGINEIKRILNKGIILSKKYKTDIFGFGNILYKYYPNIFNNYNWDDYGFIKSRIETKINLNIRFKGSAKKSIKEAIS